MYQAKVLADSVSRQGHRLLTVEATYPRIIHSELMTHRMFSRNAASTRAIPFRKAVQIVEDDPFVPIVWPKNGPGMVADGEIEEQKNAQDLWNSCREEVTNFARGLDFLGVHKSITGRLLEPFTWITVIISATEWENFFRLRCASDAEPHIRKIAFMLRDLYESSEPKLLAPGEWHLPLVWEEDRAEADSTTLRKVSAGRCARVSYLTHDGKRDIQADIDLHDRLVASGHWSPLEHQATPLDDGAYITRHAAWYLPANHRRHGVEDLQRHWNTYGNLVGWKSYRNTIPCEDGRSTDR